MANLTTYYNDSYDGGLNDTDNPRDIKDNEASVLRNWDITARGELFRRDGLTLIGSAYASGATAPATGFYPYIRSSGAKDLMLTHGSSIRYLNSTTWDSLDTTLTNDDVVWMENVPTLNRVYISSENNNLRNWDRVSTALNSCVSVSAATIPHGNVLRWHKNHMFTMNNVNVNGTKYPHRLYFSSFGDPDTWPSGNFFEIPGQGRAVTMVDLGDNLVLFKERAIQFLSGYGASEWTLTASNSNVANIDEQVGIAGPRAATRVGNEVWFVDDEGQIRRLYRTDFDAFRRDIVSTKIQGTLETVNKSQLHKTAAWSNNDKVYFAFPIEAGTYNTLVCVFDLITSKRTNSEAWTTYTGWTPGIFTDYPTSSGVKLYMTDATTGKVYEHSGDDDNGTAIDARWDGKVHDFDSPERWKTYMFGYFYAETPSSGTTVSLYGSVDQTAYTKLKDFALTSSGDGLGPTGTFRLGPTGTSTFGSGGGLTEGKYYFNELGGRTKGKSVGFSIRHNAANVQPTVRNFTVHLDKKQLR